MQRWRVTTLLTASCTLSLAALISGATTTSDPVEEIAPTTTSERPAMSDETETCIDCHASLTPGIVADWRSSRHASTSVAQALKLPEHDRRVSVTEPPKALGDVVVGCYECHGHKGTKHKDSFDHEGMKIHVVVTPKDCEACHPVEVAQFSHSKKAYALDNLRKNPLFRKMVLTVSSRKEANADGELSDKGAAENTLNTGCYACHGTAVRVRGMKSITTVDGETMKVPELSNWPNHGVGRINPDGSRGACTACHPRHSFSIEVARKPRTCAQCHLAPDTPAWEIWRESKHGNIVLSLQGRYSWDAVPWKVGQDFTAPTCATCHMSLLSTPEGDLIAERTHDLSSRLWVRLFGLPYAHAQPKDGRTFRITNKAGLPLPNELSGEPSAGYLIDEKEQAIRRARMTRVCRGCHSTDYAERHFAMLGGVVDETNKMTLAATKLLEYAWDKELANRRNFFDEALEMLWAEQWLFYANSIRMAAAMGGPDYATFKNGWWKLSHELLKLEEETRAQ